MLEDALQSPNKPSLEQFVAGLNPSYFSIVMATGIVAMASSLNGMPAFGLALTWLNLAVYAVLWTLTLWRLIAYPKKLLADVQDVRKSFGFFTTVAGTNVLGVEAIRVLHQPAFAFGLWCVGVGLWFLFTYAVFYFAMAHARKPDWKEALGGGWLLAVVACQSCAVLGSQVSKASEMLALASGFWFCSGSLLYIVIIAAIFFRLTLFDLDASQVAPPYWINMGAISITTLAGTRIISDAPKFPGTMGSLLPFFSGITFLFWAFATWWIPLLILLGLWKHAVTRLPLSYTPSLWAMVFPLGMYATCSKMMESTFHVHTFGQISSFMAYVAIAVWVVVALGLAKSVISR
ncbi:MAG: tellurite resistance/C4-dicarboxylate transporter family protein [Fimbriimonas sp.]|nr:tellurite resistance/C4-dicarboxylate transporter family protein [Fimbriimonas sp.]